MLWLIFAILTLAVIAILLMPLLKKAPDALPARAEYDIVVYRNQLAEIEQDVESGHLTEVQAEAARTEVHRRMLAAEDADLKTPAKPVRADNRYMRYAAIIAIAVVLPVGAVTFYLNAGSPQLPGKPYAWRLKHDPDFVMAATTEKLAEMLRGNPDPDGYKRLANMYFSARAYDQSAAADRRAIELGAKDATTWSELGEAIVMTNNAVVPEAMQAFANALNLDPKNARARFYIGLAESQIGNLKQAVAIWRDLEKDTSPDAPWLPMVREHIAVFSKQGGFDPASVPPSPPSAQTLHAGMTAMAGAPHPPGEQNAPAAAPSDAAPPANGTITDPQILAMVQGLADRMAKNPGDAAGWQRLARSYNVLGQHDKARTAIDHAVRLKPADVGVQLTLAEIQKAAAPGEDTPADFTATMRTVLKLDPANVPALYYVGLAEQKAGHPAQAQAMWKKALAGVAAGDPLAAIIRKRLGSVPGTANTP